MAMYEERYQYRIGIGTSGTSDSWNAYLKAHQGRTRIKPNSVVVRKNGSLVYGNGTQMATDDGSGIISGANLTGAINYTTGYLTLEETGTAFGAGEIVCIDFVTEGVNVFNNDWILWRQVGQCRYVGMSNEQYNWGTTTNTVLNNIGQRNRRLSSSGNAGIQHLYDEDNYDGHISVRVIGNFNSTIMQPCIYPIIKLDTTDSPNYQKYYAFTIHDATYFHFVGGYSFLSDLGLTYSMRISKSGGWGFATYNWYGIRLDCYRIGNNLRFHGYYISGISNIEQVFSNPQWTLILDCAHINGNSTPVKYDTYVNPSTYTQAVSGNGFNSYTTPFYSGKFGFGLGRGAASHLGHTAMVQVFRKPL